MQPDWAFFYDNQFPGGETHRILCSLQTTAACVCFLIGHFLAVIFTASGTGASPKRHNGHYETLVL